MADMQRSTGEPEAIRRQDGGGARGPLPGSEAARGNETPANTPAGEGVSTETWKPGEDNTAIRPGSPARQAMEGTAPADAPGEIDDDPQSNAPIPQPASAEPKGDGGADAPSHGSR